MIHTRFQNGFSQEFSDVVAKAASALPPLVSREDSGFMQHMLSQTVEAFWNNYITSLPQDAQDEFLRIEESGTGEEMAHWYSIHFDLAKNAEQRALAESVMNEIDGKLTGVMAKEYQLFMNAPVNYDVLMNSSQQNYEFN